MPEQANPNTGPTGPELALEDRIQVLDGAVLRVASWPIESLIAFAAPDLAAQADAVLAAAERVESHRRSVVDALAAAVGGAADPGLRRHLLALRRAVHRGDGPLPETPDDLAGVIDAADPTTAGVIAGERERRTDLRRRRERLEAAHTETLAAQLELLRTSTSTPAFLRALCFANERIAARWSAGVPPSPKARVRRLENSVFRHLARASGRATPQGAWAGVAVALTDGDRGPPDDVAASGRLRVRPATGRSRVSVDLAVLAPVVDALARWDRYALDRPLRCATPPDGAAPRPAPDPFATLVLDAYADGRSRAARPVVDALAAAVARGERSALPSVRSRIAGAVRALVAAGALVGGPRLSVDAPDAWTAAERVAALLDPPDASVWVDTVGALRAVCARAGGGPAGATQPEVAAVLGALEDAHELVSGLWRWAGVAGSPPRPVLVVDLVAPWTVTTDTAFVERARRAVAAVLGFHAGLGAAEEFRRARALDPGAPPATPHRVGPADSFAGALGAVGVAPDVVAGLDGMRRLDHLVADHRAGHPGEPELDVAAALAGHPGPVGPAGAMLFSLAGPDRLRFEWGRPQPGLFLHRFAALLAGSGDGPDPTAALRATYASWPDLGVTPVQLVPSATSNPGAALGPRWCTEVVDPLDATDTPPVCARPTPDGTRWLVTAPSGEAQVPVYDAAAPLDGGDQVRRLGAMAASHGWELLAGGVLALPCEHAGLRSLSGTRPRLSWADRVILAGRRWTVEAGTLGVVSDGPDVERYLSWRRWCRDHDVPDLVWVRVDARPDGPALAVPATSPLALRALFDLVDIAADTDTEPAEPLARLVVTEPPGSWTDWPVVDEAGHHYLAELAVSWHDPGHWPAVLGPAR